MSFSDIFQELPVVINNLGLVSAYLLELQEGGFTSMQFKELDLNTSPYLEKTFELLMHNFDNLTKHQNNFAYYQRVLAKQQIQLERIVNSPLHFFAFSPPLNNVFFCLAISQ